MKNDKKKVRVDAKFFRTLRKLLNVVFPGFNSKEGVLVVSLTILLVLRTLLSVMITKASGRNAQLLVSRNWEKFLRGVFGFFLLSFPAALINSSRKYIQGMLSLHSRVRLSNYLLGDYLKGVNFYKAVTYGGKNKITNADQRVTSDISMWSDQVTELYAETFKPLLDVVTFTYQLTMILGWQGPVSMYLYFVLSAMLKKFMPSVGRLVAQESELEGQYRTAHTRLTQNAEEIAFYNGVYKEKEIIENTLRAIEAHGGALRFRKFVTGCFDQLLVKYWASIAGYLVVTMPFLLNLEHVRNHTVADVTRDYILNAQYLGRLAQAVGDLVMIGNKLSSISGYTSRVVELQEAIYHWNNNNKPFEIKEDVEKDESASATVKVNASEIIALWKEKFEQFSEKRAEFKGRRAMPTVQVRGGGTLINDNFIRFDKCDIVSPEGKVLVNQLSVEIPAMHHVMVTGPNGCGKSSLFRVIGELWPLQCGTLVKPKREDLLFIPQKPYLVSGTLRDQIIYPHTVQDMHDLGVTDNDLAKLLSIVDPIEKITGTWKWDDVKDWFLAFSGGQKQRVAIARCFYHKPKFAILDECTSAVSQEIEDTIYQTCKEMGITIFTVSHRASLKSHHDSVLSLDGRGGWSLEAVAH